MKYLEIWKPFLKSCRFARNNSFLSRCATLVNRILPYGFQLTEIANPASPKFIEIPSYYREIPWLRHGFSQHTCRWPIARFSSNSDANQTSDSTGSSHSMVSRTGNTSVRCNECSAYVCSHRFFRLALHRMDNFYTLPELLISWHHFRHRHTFPDDNFDKIISGTRGKVPEKKLSPAWQRSSLSSFSTRFHTGAGWSTTFFN